MNRIKQKVKIAANEWRFVQPTHNNDDGDDDDEYEYEIVEEVVVEEVDADEKDEKVAST